MGSELLLFAKSFWYGMIMMVGYDFFRISRRVIRHRPAWIIVEDLCYWIGSGFFLFSWIYRENSGILRGYFFVGLVLGMVIWHNTIGDFLVRFIAGIVSFFTKRLKFLILRCKIFLCKHFCRFFRKS